MTLAIGEPIPAATRRLDHEDAPSSCRCDDLDQERGRRASDQAYQSESEPGPGSGGGRFLNYGGCGAGLLVWPAFE
jgi:hypothetical protein